MSDYIAFPALGWKFSISPYLVHNLQLFGLTINIRWYGVMIAVGFLLAMIYALRSAKRFGINSDRMIDVVLVSTLIAFVGARLYYVVFSDDRASYFANPISILEVWNGGLAIYGGILFAFITGIVMCRWRKVNTLAMFDLASLGFLIGQGIGRWGNFFNQEAFGCNTNSIFGMSGGRIQEWITDQYPSTTYFANFGTALDASQPVHPCFLYESVWCLLGFVLLALFAKKIRRYDGQIFLIYICWYGAERAVVEGLRTDSLVIGNVRVSQILAICCVVVSVILQIAIGTKVKRMGVDYHMYKDTAESKRMLAEYEAGKTGADTAEDSESNETESTDDTTDTTTEADASDASADNDDTATENCENENEKE